MTAIQKKMIKTKAGKKGWAFKFYSFLFLLIIIYFLLNVYLISSISTTEITVGVKINTTMKRIQRVV